MNNKKFAFIICTNDAVMLKECIMYINLLNVPDGYTTDIITIEDAGSMCEGYNAAMNDSDAKYKIYLHQDVFIVNRDLLTELLDIFSSDRSIGMVGMVGAPRLDKNAIMWEVPRVGNLKTAIIEHMDFGIHPGKIVDVDCIDGLFMATQYDVPWREDIFKSFHFYDISQSFEFKRNGYRVVVRDTYNDGVIHDDGIVNMFYWEPWRQICIKEYHDFLSPVDYRKAHGLKSGLDVWKGLYENRESYLQIYSKTTEFMEQAIRDNNLNLYSRFISMVESSVDIYHWSNTIVKLYNMTDIVMNEEKAGVTSDFFLDNVSSVQEAMDKYQICRQMIMRQKNVVPKPYIDEAERYICQISDVARTMLSKSV